MMQNLVRLLIVSLATIFTLVQAKTDNQEGKYNLRLKSQILI